MIIRTWDSDGSRALAVATLRPRLSEDCGDHWGWKCDCGARHEEDERAQEDGILQCEECGRQYVDREEYPLAHLPGTGSGGDPGNLHCENHCGWRGTEDELIPDPDQSESDEDQNGTRYVCPRCLTCCAMIDDADTE